MCLLVSALHILEVVCNTPHAHPATFKGQEFPSSHSFSFMTLSVYICAPVTCRLFLTESSPVLPHYFPLNLPQEGQILAHHQSLFLKKWQRSGQPKEAGCSQLNTSLHKTPHSPSPPPAYSTPHRTQVCSRISRHSGLASWVQSCSDVLS